MSDEKWYHFKDHNLSIRVTTDGKPFKLGFYYKDAYEEVEEGTKEDFEPQDKVASYITPNGPDFLGSTWWTDKIEKNLAEDPDNDISEDEAKKIVKRFSKYAEEDLKIMAENLGQSEEDDREMESEDDGLKEKAERFLTNPSLLVRLDDAFHDEMAVENRNAMLNFIVCVSTLLGDKHEPINLDWSGRTSTGKTVVAITPLEFFPQEMVMDYIGMSEKSLYHDGEEIDEKTSEVDFNNKILVVLEKENSREALEQIKPILSHDKKVHTYKYAKEAGEVMRVRMKGWPVFIGCSVEHEADSELDSRSITATPEIGSRKYGSVIDWKALNAWAPWEENGDETKRVIRKAVSMLEPMNVWIPFIPEIRRNFPDESARHQRDWDRLESIIASVTLLHQYQRDTIETEKGEFLVATPYDAKVAMDVLQGVLEQTMMGLERDVIKFYQDLQRRKKKHGGDIKWTYRQLMGIHKDVFGESISYTQIKRRMVDPLKEVGAVQINESSKTHKVKVKEFALNARFPDLDKMIEEIESIEYSEEALKERFFQACKAHGDNPGPDFDMRDNNSLNLESLMKVYGEFKRRLRKSAGDDPFDWSFGEVEEADDLDDLLMEEEDGKGNIPSQREKVKGVARFYNDRYKKQGEIPHLDDFVTVVSDSLEIEGYEDYEVSTDEIREICDRLENEHNFSFRKEDLGDF
jgi:hypothetical protein